MIGAIIEIAIVRRSRIYAQNMIISVADSPLT